MLYVYYIIFSNYEMFHFIRQAIKNCVNNFGPFFKETTVISRTENKSLHLHTHTHTYTQIAGKFFISMAKIAAQFRLSNCGNKPAK